MQPRRRHLFLALLVATAALLAVPSLASAAGDLTPSPTSLDFGAQDIHNGPSPGSAVVFTNSTGSDLNVSSVSVTGADAGDFPIIGNDCGFVPDTGVCKVALQFDPTTVGPASAQLELVDDNGTVIVPLSGTGATGTLSGSSPSFYPQPYFYGSQTQNANVNNFSSFGVQPGGVSITGPDASYFSVNFNDCNFFLKPSNGCGIGVTFNPGNAPGTRNAQLELSNDGTVDPLVIPLTATALAGPVAQVTPALYDFGAVAVGSVSFSKTFTVSNTGDSPLQIQQLLILSGTPQLFPITGDSCSGQFVNPGGACQFTVRFQPSSTGIRNASIFLISNQQGTVTTVPLEGDGVISPSGSATVDGRVAAGSALTCTPHGYPDGVSYAYQWLRNGDKVAGATARTLTPTDSDVGSTFSCRVTATNAVGSQTATSPKSAKVAPRDLSDVTGSLVDRPVCRAVRGPGRIAVGGNSVRILYGDPVTPWATLDLSAPGAGGLQAAIDGNRVGRGNGAVAITPRALAGFGNGPHELRVATSSGAAKTEIALAPCRLAIRFAGGPAGRSTATLSARAGINSARVRLPRGLRVRHLRRAIGTASIQTAGHPEQSFGISGRRSFSNGIRVKLGRHAIKVSHLPPETGVVRISFQAGTIAGRGGAVRARASLRAAGGPTRATSAAIWGR